MQIPTLTADQTATKSVIDEQIRTYCADRASSARAVHQRYALLWETIQSLLLAGGKRLRPYLLLTAYTAYNKDSSSHDDILPAATAIELLHAAMLIHDDILDRDTIRYGVKNIAGQYNDIYAPVTSDEHEKYHLSLSTALLAGDILLSDSYKLLHSVQRPAELIAKASELFSKAVFEVVGGELIDGEAAFLPAGIIAPETVAQYKTASYSFAAPLTIGAALAGAPETDTVLLSRLSNALGIGYQLRDDLLGVFGDETQTGKSTATDIVEGKRTLLIQSFDELASTLQKERFYAVFHKASSTPDQLAEARNLLVEAGAKQAIETRIEELLRTSESIVEMLSIDNSYKIALQQFITDCLKRDI